MGGYVRSATEAEANAAARMRDLGYADAKISPAGADAGLDVISSRAVAQVKCKSSMAGRPDLQRLYGARGKHRNKELWFFAASGYSKQAIEYADDHDVLLFTYDITGILTPANVAAVQKLKQARSADPSPNRSPDFERNFARNQRRLEVLAGARTAGIDVYTPQFMTKLNKQLEREFPASASSKTRSWWRRDRSRVGASS